MKFSLALGRADSRIAARFIQGLMILAILVGAWSCGSGDKEEEEADQAPYFESVVGIDYYEVRRTFDTGVSYDTIGFVQLPEWHLRFAKKDSVLVYSPFEDRMLGYKVYHDHEDYYHFARDSWRVIELHPDSITLQRLSLNGLRVNKVKSNVYMKFYSKSFIENNIGNPDQTLVEKVDNLRLPTRQDTAFVAERVAIANRNPKHLDSTFASRNFAELTSKSPAISVKKRKIEHIELTEKSPAYEYLYPEYTITIDRAYRDFGHDFSVIVDEQGKMHLGKVFVMEEFVGPREKVVQGIIDVYLHNLLEIKPAHTLGMPHASVIYLYVKGKEVIE